MQKLWDRIFNEESGIGTALTAFIYYTSYQETYRFLHHSQWWTDDQIKNYQWQQLKILFNHAYKNVPYYTNLFETMGITPDNIQSIHDFQQLPFLTKEIVQEHLNELKATNYPLNNFEENVTGGSTGFLLNFYVEKGVWFAKHMAFIQTLLDRAGCSSLDKSVHITGSERPWEYRPFSRTLVLSSFHMTDENLPIYVKKIKRLQPQYIMGYPSAITILATFIKNHNIDMSDLKAIFCYGETIYDRQRDFLEGLFHCRVYSQYGLREQVVLAGTCENSNCYHIFPEYGFVELIDNEGNQITSEDQIGEIVATGFHTSIFPFIRYKTGDLGIYTNHQCNCGRCYPLLKDVTGRLQDFVVSKTKRLVPFIGVDDLIVKSSQNIKEFQLYQEKEGVINLRIVRSKRYSDADERFILERFQKRFSDEFTIIFHYVDSIPRTSRGKYQFLIQKLPIQLFLYNHRE